MRAQASTCPACTCRPCLCSTSPDALLRLQLRKTIHDSESVRKTASALLARAAPAPLAQDFGIGDDMFIMTLPAAKIGDLTRKVGRDL